MEKFLEYEITNREIKYSGNFKIEEVTVKNNDKEFKMVVDRLKKNIPEKESNKYALRRTRSDNLFEIYNKKPIVQPSENLYIDD